MSRPSTRCTSTPSAAKVPAYSLPITPPPITMSFFGSALSSRISFESCTRSSSKGNSGGRSGDEPVAMRIFSPRISVSAPSFADDADRVRIHEDCRAVEPGHAAQLEPRLDALPFRCP